MATTTTTEQRCTCLAPDGGEVIRVFDEEFMVKVTGAQTRGTYAVIAGTVAPGGGPPLHAHPGSETFYVLSGEFLFTQRDGERISTFRAGPGAVVHAPGGVPHRFENVSATRSAMVSVGAAESIDFLRDLGAAFPPGASPDMETMLEIHARYRIETFHGEEGSRPEPPTKGSTSARARMLAWRYAQANDELIKSIARCTPKQWRAICADTGWTVAVQAHHVAVNEAIIARVIVDAAMGQPHPPMPKEKLDAINARHAEEFADVTVSETVALLRDNGPAAAESYRCLSNDQLNCVAVLTPGEPPRSVAELIEDLAVGEIERHGASIRQAIGA